MTRLTRNILLLITLGYIIVTALFAVRVPDWQTPDEPAHYNYVRQIVENRRLPKIEAGDWDQEYLEALKHAQFPPPLLANLDSIQYEDHQPPLFYLLAAPVYIVTNGSLTALRLYSALIGVVIVWCAFGVGLLMFPQRPWIGLAAAAFVAFEPQHVHILASFNNDSLGWAVIALTLLYTVAYLKNWPLFGRSVKPWHLGILVGIGFLTKTTTYFMAAVVPTAILLRHYTIYRRSIDEVKDLTFPEETQTLHLPYQRLLTGWWQFLLPALILGAIWWLRSIIVYGFPDFLGLAAHDAVVIGQPRTRDLIEAVGTDGYIKEITRVTFHSFWGQFGWMALPLEARFYTLIQAALVFAFAGLGIDMAYLRGRDQMKTTAEQRNVWLILVSVTVLSIAAFLYYNTEFQQHQGRYLFSLLIPLGIWLALGVDAWRRLIFEVILPLSARTRNSSWLLTVLAFFVVAAFDLWQLWRVIVPNL